MRGRAPCAIARPAGASLRWVQSRRSFSALGSHDAESEPSSAGPCAVRGPRGPLTPRRAGKCLVGRAFGCRTESHRVPPPWMALTTAERFAGCCNIPTGIRHAPPHERSAAHARRRLPMPLQRVGIGVHLGAGPLWGAVPGLLFDQKCRAAGIGGATSELSGVARSSATSIGPRSALRKSHNLHAIPPHNVHAEGHLFHRGLLAENALDARRQDDGPA